MFNLLVFCPHSCPPNKEEEEEETYVVLSYQLFIHSFTRIADFLLYGHLSIDAMP